MKADVFLERATDPDEWVQRSTNLKQSADVLWRRLLAAKDEYARSLRAESPDDEKLDECIGYLGTSHMLYGLAVETALKEYLFRTQPGEVEFKIVADGEGEAVEASIERLGTSMRDSHDLHKLAHAAGLFERGEDQLFEDDSRYGTLKDVLDQLSDAVLWSARYPVPLHSDGNTPWPGNTSQMELTFGIKEWVDELLDKLQGPDAI